MQHNDLDLPIKDPSASVSKINTHTQNVAVFSSTNESCLLDCIYTAGCYANLSYIFSKIHPDNLESITHQDTLLLAKLHKSSIIEVYDITEKPNVGAVIIPLDQEVIITFHGANFTRRVDHITNFEANLITSKYAPGLYHAGFLKSATLIIPKIIAQLKERYKPFYEKKPKFRIYGHSMGGAIAQLLTQYLQHTYTDLNIETIIFGSPKVMCPVAANAYDKQNKDRTLRVENPLDLAIYMPTQFMGYGVVNHPVLLSTTHKIMSKNHELEGYLKSVDTIRKQFRNYGISIVSLKDYTTASSKFNPLYTWIPTNISPTSRWSSVSEFMHLLGHGLSKAIQSLIRALPFRS